MNYQIEKIKNGEYRIWGPSYDTVHLCTKTEADEIVAQLEAKWLGELKLLKIAKLNENLNVVYEKYVGQYPEVEVRTFEQKARECFLVKADADTPLDKTPMLCALVGNDKEARNTLAGQVYEKVAANARIETWGVTQRDAIKAAASEDELEAICIEVACEYLGGGNV